LADCASSGGANVSLILYDQYGDGWNGNVFNIYSVNEANGDRDELMYTNGFCSGWLVTDTICLEKESTYEIVVTEGDWTGEVAWTMCGISMGGTPWYSDYIWISNEGECEHSMGLTTEVSSPTSDGWDGSMVQIGNALGESVWGLPLFSTYEKVALDSFYDHYSENFDQFINNDTSRRMEREFTKKKISSKSDLRGEMDKLSSTEFNLKKIEERAVTKESDKSEDLRNSLLKMINKNSLKRDDLNVIDNVLDFGKMNQNRKDHQEEKKDLASSKTYLSYLLTHELRKDSKNIQASPESHDDDDDSYYSYYDYSSYYYSYYYSSFSFPDDWLDVDDEIADEDASNTFYPTLSEGSYYIKNSHYGTESSSEGVYFSMCDVNQSFAPIIPIESGVNNTCWSTPSSSADDCSSGSMVIPIGMIGSVGDVSYKIYQTDPWELMMNGSLSSDGRDSNFLCFPNSGEYTLIVDSEGGSGVISNSDIENNENYYYTTVCVYVKGQLQIEPTLLWTINWMGCAPRPVSTFKQLSLMPLLC